jgi:hypothetical protein
MRPDHQAYKDAVTGVSKNLPQHLCDKRVRPMCRMA